MSSRTCKYDADAVCYIYGQFRDVKYELKTSYVLCEAYEAYFDCPVRHQDKPWAPHVAFSYCERCLEVNMQPIEYPELESSSGPIAHDLTRPVPEPTKKLSQKSSLSLSSSKSNSDREFLPTLKQPKYHLITTEDFNDLVRDLNLPKNKAELLGSRLKQWTGHETFLTFFTKEDGLCFCNDIKGMVEEFGIP
ncbi:unnamed protein product [Brassicogethes aeneus]|uniref:Uncharacterized protein n=1 Tax=Brassicogethes aeneus TaxID=1431903 RepID=A0A9P0B9A1_BRAAE|nr:unnamed protein product [Brassicogethes aeneus]